jgi:hypothetical protein
MRGFASDPAENRDGTDPVLCVDCDERVPMPGYAWCDDCNTERGEAQDEAASAAFHGGSSPYTSAERMAVAYRRK